MWICCPTWSVNHVLFDDFEEMGLSDQIGPFCRYQGVDVGRSSKLVVIPKNNEDMAVRKPTFLKFDNYESFWFTKLGLVCSPGLAASNFQQFSESIDTVN